jgi:hypothetical protein
MIAVKVMNCMITPIGVENEYLGVRAYLLGRRGRLEEPHSLLPKFQKKILSLILPNKI